MVNIYESLATVSSSKAKPIPVFSSYITVSQHSAECVNEGSYQVFPVENTLLPLLPQAVEGPPALLSHRATGALHAA